MSGSKPRIVVIEDDASMSQAIERILRAGRFEPIMFGSAEEVLETDMVAKADCMVLDVRLPGMSGFDLYRGLSPARRKPPAIFITAQDEPSVRGEANRIGASGYLPKPFSGRALLDAVAEALSAHRNQTAHPKNNPNHTPPENGR